jgi:DinB family protein
MNDAEKAALIARVLRGPGQVSRVFSMLTDEQLRAPLAPGEWSPAEALAHLRAADDIQSIRAYMILARDEPPLPAFDERVWSEVAGYLTLHPRASLDLYFRRRIELAHMLRGVARADFERAGVHEALGRLTLQGLLENLASHEEEHVAQLEVVGAGE